MADEICRAASTADLGRRPASDDKSFAIMACSQGGICGNPGTPAAILSLRAFPVSAAKGARPAKRKKIKAPIE
jgi:hypothetical protein